MIWVIAIGIIAALVYFSRFNAYMKKYLVPFEIRIISQEKTIASYHINFSVVFGKGYFKREYFTAIGYFVSDKEFTLPKLKEMLVLTEITPFYQGDQLKSSDYTIEYKYSIDGDYTVSYTIIDQAALDFAERAMNE